MIKFIVAFSLGCLVTVVSLYDGHRSEELAERWNAPYFAGGSSEGTDFCPRLAQEVLPV